MNKLIQAAGFAALVSLAGASQATELNFNVVNLTGANASYGDRITSFGGSYGSAGGPTPNIEVDFQAFNNLPFSIYPSGYASLIQALGHGLFDSPGHVQLTPDAGFDVVLMSFQVAAWGGDVHDNSRIRVFDLVGNNLFDTGVFSFQPQTVLTFPGQPIRSSVGLHIRVEDFGDLGLDNLVFGQVASVPEASTVTMMLAGLVAVGGLARRRGARGSAAAVPPQPQAA